MGGGLYRLPFYLSPRSRGRPMKNTKFIVKVNRGGTRAPEYVQRIDRAPIPDDNQP